MNKNKLLYEQPGCKILVVRFGGLLMVSGDPVYNVNGTEDGYTRNGSEEGYGWS